MGIDFFNAGGSIDNEKENIATINSIKIESNEITYNVNEHKLTPVEICI